MEEAGEAQAEARSDGPETLDECSKGGGLPLITLPLLLLFCAAVVVAGRRAPATAAVDKTVDVAGEKAEEWEGVVEEAGVEMEEETETEEGEESGVVAETPTGPVDGASFGVRSGCGSGWR